MTGARSGRRRSEVLPVVGSAVLIALLLGTWQFAVSVVDVSSFILPAPAAVGRALVDVVTSPGTWVHVRVTLVEVVGGFAVALAAGIATGVVLGRVPWLERATRPALVAFQVVPKVAFVPVLVIWFGFGPTSKIVMAAILAFLPIALNVLLGVRSVDRGHRDVMRGLGAGRWATFRDLELPTTLPYVFTGAEVAVVFAVIGAVVGEYLGGNAGLGFLVVRSLNALDAPRLFAVIVLLTLIGVVLHAAVATARRLAVPWHDGVVVGRR